MDWGDTRTHQRGGRRGRGTYRGRGRPRASRNQYFESHYDVAAEGNQYHASEDFSQKDESYNQEYPHNFRGGPPHRGRGRGAPRGAYRGGYRGGRGRARRGGYQYSEHSEESNEFNFHPQTHNTHNPHKPHKPQKYQKPQRFEHKEYHRREDQPKERYYGGHEAEEAKVYYQADDFLKKYDKLPEKTEYLVKELCQGSIQCAICHNDIAQISAIWNCKQCYQPLHLGCIRRWIKKVNAEAPIQAMPYENRKEEVDENDQSVGEGRIAVNMDKSGGVYIDQTDCYNWTCPNCAYNYTETMPKYYCYCRKDINPEFSSFYLPHSCSKICNKSKNQYCLHSNCNLECHPGA